MENKEITVPVLFIGFNRPEVSLQTFGYIRKAKPTKLYIAIDGPRADKPGEEKLVAEVKKVVENVDWPCETHYKYNETNKGAEITVSSAISWVFETEEYAIILEDDIVAPLSFFKFAQKMLVKYKDDGRIGLISGNNFTPIPVETDYFFAKYGHSWGWATWKRVWESFDLNIEIEKQHLKMGFLKSISNSRAEALFYKKRYKQMRKRGAGNNTWDMVANYISRTNRRINIVPSVNLTSNIGIYGLHAKGESVFHNVPFDENFIVKKHPTDIEMNVDYDKHHFKEHILKHQKNIFQRIINKLTRIILKRNIF
ncbi:MAG: hypothetical protein PHD00_06700 [Bacteroidales bacterium]|nr:hypothetical protein [Bacteroidales bacterium]